jgi:hypothetical protein
MDDTQNQGKRERESRYRFEARAIARGTAFWLSLRGRRDSPAR